MKKFILLILLLFFPFPLLAQDIPEWLEKIGFTKYTLVSYEKKANVEYFTFSDWKTVQSGDTITFVVENGKIINWLKEEEKIEKEDSII